MDSGIKIYIERANNELLLAKVNFNISTEIKLKDILNIPREKTFFNDIISQAYYSIFYAAKAYILQNGIITKPPEEHKKTYNNFKKFVKSGKIDKELLEIYKTESEKAEVLLNIFFEEKRKRGIFTYKVDSEANIPSAQESINNAIKFVSTIINLIEKNN